MKLHKEGYPTIIIVLLFISLVNYINYMFLNMIVINVILSVVSLIFFCLVLYFFRDPKRDIEIKDNHIIAPSDGKLVVIEDVYESEYLNEQCTQLSIFMSPLNVHKQWYPNNGKIIYSKYHPGKFLVAWHPKSSTENERTTIVIETNNKYRILYRQIAGAVARRICNYAIEGETIDQSMEAGFIKFGSRIDVLIPKKASLNVSLNDRIIGGKTILAKL
jgi:phosphatidylserine decarboxylase